MFEISPRDAYGDDHEILDRGDLFEGLTDTVVRHSPLIVPELAADAIGMGFEWLHDAAKDPNTPPEALARISEYCELLMAAVDNNPNTGQQGQISG